MGVSGTVGVLTKYSQYLGQWQTLANTKLVVDVTDGMGWFVKRNLKKTPDRADLYGSSMVELCALYRDLFKRLKERNITPIIVYNGGRVSEEGYGQVASKHQFLERSCHFALQNLSAKKFRALESLPSLAHVAIKEVINEFNFELVYQSPYEVYPLLERLSRQHNCPVLTSHSDYIFTNIPAGFIWLDRLEVPTDSTSPLRGCLYKHEKMLAYFKRTPEEGSAMRGLYALLRDDFSQTHYNALNNLLNLTGNIMLRPRGDRAKTQRLLYVLNNWPKQLDSLEKVRSALMAIQNRQVGIERDYRGIMESFSIDNDFSQSELARAFVPAEIGDFNGACTRRETSASFLMELKQRHTFNRMSTVEDLRTTRSTYSLADRTRQYLLTRLHESSLSIFDRRRSDSAYRTLTAMQVKSERMNIDHQSEQQAMTCDQLFELFHFDAKTLELVGSMLQQLHVDLDNSRRLALVLLLARFGYKLAFRDTLDNEDRKSRRHSLNQGVKSDSSNGSSGGSGGRSPAAQYLTQDMRRKFYTSIVNSYVYHSSNEHQGDPASQSTPAEIRVAHEKMASLEKETMQGLGDELYFSIKHLIETLNVSLHTYKELNSLYNFVGPNVLVNKYYDGLMIYRLMRKWSNNLKEFLLPVDGQLLDVLSE